MREADPDRGTTAPVRAMTQMAEALGLKTVVEIDEPPPDEEDSATMILPVLPETLIE